jgi:hypothetical protein
MNHIGVDRLTGLRARIPENGKRMATEATFDDIVRYLRKEGWTFGIGDTNSISMAVEGEKTLYSVLIRFPWEKEIIIIYVRYPFRIPDTKRPEALDLAARINQGLLFGTCEYAHETGEVRFRSTMLTDGAPFHPEQFSTLLATALANAERFSPAFRALLEARENGDSETEKSGRD